MERFYFWEKVPGLGVRQLGRVDGYPSMEELKADMGTRIEHNVDHGYPVTIMKATPFIQYGGALEDVQ